ncbi:MULTISPECIES: biliverdin-producing heme oxygenase [unclassified Streptomyces]|uniref:biliverdin-producing heme oxygenase n=1 Tax=unclassified Streptomyces TaxID=2593676 RepID=UPI00202E4938|nr:MULTISPECIES: biliverdin-producing heme oxygenase [unclassified Streptomyces]MCM1969258.1 biliverdin-producing heme oxygenase [Streptomyces sp. G1]MCX5122854.1 biliverdin-producing heme oxygenase [Streptomyces sp. NBC_00347]MCX5296211.1 biliverdin-producing heme oxygenase [Streptomyces sp. NBC_00193]
MSPTDCHTVVDRIRASTRGRHQDLEGTPFSLAMLAGTLPLDRYVDQLAAYRRVLGALEAELSRATDPCVTSVWSADLVKIPCIDRDLMHFAEDGVFPASTAAAPADALAREIRAAAASDPPALLGFLYVLEGSTLGGAILRRYVAEAYGLRDTDGVAYYASGDRERWAGFTARLNAALPGPGEQDRVLAAVGRAYHHVAAISAALSTGLVAAEA